MSTRREQELRDLVNRLLELTDQLPNFLECEEGGLPKVTMGNLKTFDGLQDAAAELWRLCRETQVADDINQLFPAAGRGHPANHASLTGA